jgi:carboxysome shell carbonic anhydrase
MLSSRRQSARSVSWSRNAPKAARARSAVTKRAKSPAVTAATHPLTRVQDNQRLFDYEQRVKNAFDAIVPTLKRISALQHEEAFEGRAQTIAKEQLGFELPDAILADAWVTQLDMRRLFAWCVFQTYQQFCDDFFSKTPLGSQDDFQSFLMNCGFHTMDISPCADGRLAHVISYVLRFPYREVRRRSYAGAMFDIEDSMAKWTKTELKRFREGDPNTADSPTRYLKAVVYHYSDSDPDHEGCAAHGSDAGRAAQAGLDRLKAFQQAVQNSYCCGASIDLLLVGLDTDSDSIRVHVPDANGAIELEQYVDAGALYDETFRMNAEEAKAFVAERIRSVNSESTDGMGRLITRLITNNFSQIDYVRNYHGARYSDIGHAERFIGAGIGFEEVQLRNLTYFAYMHTVEEAAADLDVGIKIFSGLNVAHGLPIPIIVRFDYHGHVPGARERAVENCQRVASALRARYASLQQDGLLHTLLVIRDLHEGEKIEVLESSVTAKNLQEAH